VGTVVTEEAAEVRVRIQRSVVEWFFPSVRDQREELEETRKSLALSRTLVGQQLSIIQAQRARIETLVADRPERGAMGRFVKRHAGEVCSP
jgi:hypothetical protein